MQAPATHRSTNFPPAREGIASTGVLRKEPCSAIDGDSALIREGRAAGFEGDVANGGKCFRQGHRRRGWHFGLRNCVDGSALYDDAIVDELRSFDRTSNSADRGSDRRICCLAFDDDGSVLFGNGQPREACAKLRIVDTLGDFAHRCVASGGVGGRRVVVART